jgi:PadR family transcriptional regulator PadR
MARLLKAGWVEAEWEDVDPALAGRPKRRYYWLTSDGTINARAALAKTDGSRQRASAAFRPGAAGAHA